MLTLALRLAHALQVLQATLQRLRALLLPPTESETARLFSVLLSFHDWVSAIVAGGADGSLPGSH